MAMSPLSMRPFGDDLAAFRINSEDEPDMAEIHIVAWRRGEIISIVAVASPGRVALSDTEALVRRADRHIEEARSVEGG